MTVTKLLLDIEVFYQLTILSCSPALLSWSSSSSVLIFLQFRPAILALQLFGIKLIPGRPGLTLLAFLAYSSSSSSNFSSSAVCNSAIYRIYRALWACSLKPSKVLKFVSFYNDDRMNLYLTSLHNSVGKSIFWEIIRISLQENLG